MSIFVVTIIKALMYIPERIIVSPHAKEISRTNEIILGIKKLNKRVEVINISNQSPERPNLTSSELYNHIKDTLVLCTRSQSTNFLETFASPGKIAENLGVNGKIYFHCPLRCQFCYLDASGQGTRWNRVYVDWERFKAEAIKETLVNRIALTLWSAISFYEKRPLIKVPDNFKEICDKTIRKDVLAVKSKINSDRAAIKYLQSNLGNFSDNKGIKEIKKSIPVYYEQNKNKDLWINIGEYSDVVGIDHITNFLAEVMRWVQEDNALKFSFRTKCANLENLFTLPANNRIKITMNLNTQTVIDNYEIGTSSLDDRIKSINNIIHTGGFVVQLAIEPIIKYKNYFTDYENLIGRIISEINLDELRSIKFGTVRYKSGLITTIKKNIPNTDLFNENQNLYEPVKGDKRWRYSEAERIQVYNNIINKFGRKYRDKLGLAAEDPSIWDAVGLNKQAIHNDIVYQYKN